MTLSKTNPKLPLFSSIRRKRNKIHARVIVLSSYDGLDAPEMLHEVWCELDKKQDIASNTKLPQNARREKTKNYGMQQT